VDQDAVFKALADPSRRMLLDRLHAAGGLSLTELCADLDMRRQSVSQHLELLESAGLVTSVRVGRAKLHYLNPVPIHELQTRWIWKFEEPQLAALAELKHRAEKAEKSAMNENTAGAVPAYVYTSYIRATPEQVWNALTDRELTGRFWGHHQISDWKVGSRVEHVRTDGSGAADAAGVVTEIEPPHRLAFTFDDPGELDDPTFEPSLVTFDIEGSRDIVKLTVTHSRLRTEDDRAAIGQGWPAVFANLKTLLETGEVLPQAPWEFHAEERAARMARHD
jgi:uncharacterized protein YndB with AHSA1/START domain/DNA-binding transcriptional ArsR family regulator